MTAARDALSRSKEAMKQAMALITQALAAQTRAQANNLVAQANQKYNEAMNALGAAQAGYTDYSNKGGVTDNNIAWEKGGMDQVGRDAATYNIYKDVVPQMKMSDSDAVSSVVSAYADTVDAIQQAAGYPPIFGSGDACGMSAGMTGCP